MFDEQTLCSYSLLLGMQLATYEDEQGTNLILSST